MLVEVLISSLYQLSIFVGVVYVVGFLISLINRLFYKLTGKGRIVCLATGLIGTPIHELSHAVMCIVFFHKISDMKLFQTDDENGVLGYVNHSYNPRNVYQVVGNYFIGVAPIIVGTALLYALIKLMLPAVFIEVNAYMTDFVALVNDGLTIDIFSYLFVVIGAIIKAIFTIDFSYLTVIFLIVCFCVALHMNLSGADIIGSIKSLPIIILLTLIVNLILRIISDGAFSSFNVFMSESGCYLIAFLSLSLVFSLIILAVGIVIRSICFIVKR